MANYLPCDNSGFAYIEQQYGESLDESQKLVIGNNLAMFFSILNEWQLQEDNLQKECTTCIEDPYFITNNDIKTN